MIRTEENKPIYHVDQFLKAGYFRLQKEGEGIGSLVEVSPTDSWEAGYDEGYNHGFEAGLQWAGLQHGDGVLGRATGWVQTGHGGTSAPLPSERPTPGDTF